MRGYFVFWASDLDSRIARRAKFVGHSEDFTLHLIDRSMLVEDRLIEIGNRLLKMGYHHLELCDALLWTFHRMSDLRLAVKRWIQRMRSKGKSIAGVKATVRLESLTFKGGTKYFSSGVRTNKRTFSSRAHPFGACPRRMRFGVLR